MKSVSSTIFRYHMALWSIDTEARLRIRPFLNAVQYNDGDRPPDRQRHVVLFTIKGK